MTVRSLFISLFHRAADLHLWSLDTLMWSSNERHQGWAYGRIARKTTAVHCRVASWSADSWQWRFSQDLSPPMCLSLGRWLALLPSHRGRVKADMFLYTDAIQAVALTRNMAFLGITGSLISRWRLWKFRWQQLRLSKCRWPLKVANSGLQVSTRAVGPETRGRNICVTAVHRRENY